MMKISEGDIGFLHFAFKAALEYPLALASLESIDFNKQFKNKILIDEGLSIFDWFFTLKNIFYSFNDVVLIRD